MADLIGATVGGIETGAAVEQRGELASELLEFVDAGIDDGQLVVEQAVDVATRRGPVRAVVDDASNLGKCQARGLARWMKRIRSAAESS